MNNKIKQGFDKNKIIGLSDEEAKKILIKDGYNELPSQKKQGGFVILLKVLSEPMLILLICGGAIYLFLGEIQDALMLLFSVFVVIGITFYQERKTEKTLEALRDLSSPRALVIRDGEQKRIAGREVVKGDIIIIREGDRVPADAIVLSCENLSIDESLLNGE
jgi:P-type Ca2+ transporter type 2C